ncbi:fucolectin-7-like isoform X2 [Myripristis murdjan]|uniref:fucolectin-7-like isoform X2 n=1 Tax=Myripristis murdjan TaxID=586833 RepID=UPI0011760237|nr:fucolectin-7-like isoform X2 [Myripristis murdjan]
MKHTIIISLLLLLGTCTVTTALKNLALRGKATQSLIIGAPWTGYAAASNAIDGNRDSHGSAGSCSNTPHQTNPWWRVDLLDSYIITSIIITVRGDCCAELTTGANIYISDSPIQDQSTKKPDGTVPEVPLGDSFTLNFTSKVEGRYVTVKLEGHSKILSLCEVEVYGYPAASGENLALRGRATQSSVYPAGIPMNAIDGNCASNWNQGSCSHTQDNFSPWWRLDLLKTYKVVSVSITNRDDVPERINGVEIRIGNSLDNNGNNNPRCVVVSQMAGGVTETFQCDGMEGRYVNLVIPGRKEFLTLCEVEVYGHSLD